MTYDPFFHAASMKLRVNWGDPGLAAPAHWVGNTILLDARLDPREARSVLAHTLVHVEYQDEPVDEIAWSEAQERRCDRIAARRLIDQEQHSRLSRKRRYRNPADLAEALNVAEWTLRAYEEQLQVV